MNNMNQEALLSGLQDIAQKSGLDISEELGKITAKLQSSGALSKT